MEFSGRYHSSHGELNLTQTGKMISGKYGESGSIEGYVAEKKIIGNWSNKGDQGCFEWHFDENYSFRGKFKKGINDGIMKGKWNGSKINDQVQLENIDIESEDSVLEYQNFISLDRAESCPSVLNISAAEVISNFSYPFDDQFFGDLKDHFSVLIITVDNSEESIEENDGAERYSIIYDLRNNCIYLQTENTDDETFRYLLTHDGQIPKLYEEHSKFWGCYSITDLKGNWSAFFHGDFESFDGAIDNESLQILKSEVNSSSMFKFLEEVFCYL